MGASVARSNGQQIAYGFVLVYICSWQHYVKAAKACSLRFSIQCVSFRNVEGGTLYPALIFTVAIRRNRKGLYANVTKTDSRNLY